MHRRFPKVALGPTLLLLGLLLRIPTPSRDRTIHQGFAASTNAALQSAAAQTVDRFYRSLVSGDLTDLPPILEAEIETTSGTARLLSQAEIREQVRGEFGGAGISAQIASLVAVDHGRISLPDLDGVREAGTLRFLATRHPEIRVVEIAGRLIGRCSPYEFSREVLAVREESSWKVVLEMSSSQKGGFLERYFLSRDESESGSIGGRTGASAQAAGG